MTEYRLQEIPSDGISTLNDRTLRLPEWRRRKALSFLHPIDRLQSVMAYEMLADILADLYGIDLAEHEIVYDPPGKPSLTGIDGIYFSLSHCRDAVLVAVSDSPVGCDVESIHGADVYQEIVDYCYFPGEKRRIRQSDNPALTFTEIWTLKEAMFKLDNSTHIESIDTSAPVGCKITKRVTSRCVATVVSSCTSH